MSILHRYNGGVTIHKRKPFRGRPLFVVKWNSNTLSEAWTLEQALDVVADALRFFVLKVKDKSNCMAWIYCGKPNPRHNENAALAKEHEVTKPVCKVCKADCGQCGGPIL